MVCYVCIYCYAEVQIRTKAKERYDLVKNQGTFINVKCSKCNAEDSVHVNRVFAKVSRQRLLVAFVFAAIASLTIGLLLATHYWGGGIGIKRRVIEAISVGCLMPFIVWLTYWQDESRKSRIFNSHKF